MLYTVWLHSKDLKVIDMSLLSFNAFRKFNIPPPKAVNK